MGEQRSRELASSIFCAVAHLMSSEFWIVIGISSANLLPVNAVGPGCVLLTCSAILAARRCLLAFGFCVALLA